MTPAHVHPKRQWLLANQFEQTTPLYMFMVPLTQPNTGDGRSEREWQAIFDKSVGNQDRSIALVVV